MEVIAPAREKTHSDARRLLVILLAGAALRLALWFWFAGVVPHIADEKDYAALGKNLVETGEYFITAGKPTTLRPPLYPALVAAVYAATGVENFQAVRLLQAFLGLATAVLLYFLGREVYCRRVGLWLAGLYCFYPSLVGFNFLLLTETLFTLLLCAFAYAVVLYLHHNRLGYLAAGGVLLGLAALTRSVLWLFPPVLILFLLAFGPGSFVRRILAAVVVVVPFALTIAPWAVRCSRLESTFIAIDSMGGRNFMMGNYRYTPLYRSWDAINLEGEQSWLHEVHETSLPSERRTQGQLDKLALKRGLVFVQANPGLTALRDVVKFFDFWGLERELVSGAAARFFGPVPTALLPVLAVLICGAYAVVLFAALYGVLLVPPDERRVHWFVLLLIAFVCGIHTLVFAHSRYHLPVVPLVLLYAAAVFARGRNVGALWRRPVFWLAGVLCLLFVAGWGWNFVAGDLDKIRQIMRPGT